MANGYSILLVGIYIARDGNDGSTLQLTSTCYDDDRRLHFD